MAKIYNDGRVEVKNTYGWTTYINPDGTQETKDERGERRAVVRKDGSISEYDYDGHEDRYRDPGEAEYSVTRYYGIGRGERHKVDKQYETLGVFPKKPPFGRHKSDR